MTKAELETKIAELETKIAEQERKAGLLCDALRRIASLSEDGYMRIIADHALDGFFHGRQLRELLGMGNGDGGEG